jgi:hydroxymethylglutaryl-CoA synthase
MGTSTEHVAVGIEGITVHVPHHYLDLEALARIHGVDAAKFKEGLGCHAMAVPHPTQDPVTMAVSALLDLLDRYDVDAGEVGLLIVGTETGVDSSKPISAYVHGAAGMPSTCRVFDIQHACYGATAGVQMASSWVSSPLSNGRKAIVIASDVARYTPGSPGEPTQGAGAVAMLISDKPKLLHIHNSFESLHAQSVNDFWRPTYSPTAVVEGHYSVACYLGGLRSTWKIMTGRTGNSRSDFDHMIYHLPFPRMSWKAHIALAEQETGRSARSDTGFVESEKEIFRRKVEPALWASQQIGNIYTGSMWLSFAALLEGNPATVPGKRVCLYSYGSGSCSELLTGRIGDDPSAWHGRIGLANALTSRTQIDHDLYLQFRERGLALYKNGSYQPGDAPLPDHLPPKVRLVFLGVKDHMRMYRPGPDWTPADTETKRLLLRNDNPREGWFDMWMLGPENLWKVE